MPAEPRVTEAAPAPPGPASVSPADTLRRYVLNSVPMQTKRGVFPAADAYEALAALLAVGERDKALLAQSDAALTSLEVILFGNDRCRTRDELDERAEELVAAGERDRRQIARLTEALAGIGWMPCAESPYWCFCKEPSEPGSHHGDGCIVASGLLALAGRVGSDMDKPTTDTMTDSLGRPLTELQDRAGEGNT